MEKEEKNIFYIGIAEGEWGKRRELCREGLSIKRAKRRLSYLTWEGRNVQADLQVYFSLFPQFEKSISGRYRLYKDSRKGICKAVGWKMESAARIIRQTEEKAADICGCRDWVLSPLLEEGEPELPVEIMAAHLYRLRPFDSVCIILPEDGDYFVEQAMWLLRPYLPRIRQAFVCGAESENGHRLREALYLEFGLVAMQIRSPKPRMVCLDLQGKKIPMEEKASEAKKTPENGCSGDFKYIDRYQTWKFLDTMVKNGYNTKVN